MTTPYIDPQNIFASDAPTQDKPPAFNNYVKGMDETRLNDGRPTIKQFNFIQQQNDFKFLYIHERGACLPFVEGFPYENNAIVFKDGFIQQKNGASWIIPFMRGSQNLAELTDVAQARTKLDVYSKSEALAEVNGVHQELNTHIEDLLNPHQVTKGQIGLGNVDNTADIDKPVSNSTQASIISAVAPKADKTYVDNQLTLKANKSDVYTKQESSDLVDNSISTALIPVNSSLDLAKRGIANRYDSSLTYNSGERVVLVNGDIVKSTIDGNVNDPNLDMTGWFNTSTQQKKLLSHFGAIPDSIEYASHNETCLINAIKDGDVLVDGYYYIECNSVETITNSFRISSPSGNKGTLDFINLPSNWLKLGSIDYFDTINVNIKTPLSGRGVLFTIDNDLVNIGRIKIEDCYFSSQSRYFYATFSSTVDPSVTRYGVRNVHITDNEFYNPNSIFFTINMPHDYVEVKRNKVRNLTGRFFNISIGAHSFEQKLKDMSLLAECCDNTVKSDLGFLATNIVGYLTFFLYESGGHLEYTGNIVDGLATKELVVVYDCYANVKTLKQENNTWRNNLCLHVDKSHNTLMMSKAAIKSEYFNNKYYVDYDFISYHDAIAQSVVRIYSVDSTAASNDRFCIMRENRFDVYHLVGQTNLQSTKNIIFEDNKIKAFNITSFLFNIRRNADGITDLSDALISVQRNEIESKNLGMTVRVIGQDVSGFGMLSMGTSPSSFGKYKDIVVTDNKIKAEVAHGIVYFFGAVESEYLSISRNEIRVEDFAESANFIPYDLSALSYDELDAKGCVVSVKDPLVSPVRSIALGMQGDKRGAYSVRFKGVFNSQIVAIKRPTTTSSHIKVRLQSLSSAGFLSASYILKLTPTGFEYLANDDTVKTAAFSASGTVSISDIKVFKVDEVSTLASGVSVSLIFSRGSMYINLLHDGLVSGVTKVDYNVDVEVFPIQ